MRDCNTWSAHELHNPGIWARPEQSCACSALTAYHANAHQKLKLEMRCRAAPAASVSTGS